MSLNHPKLRQAIKSAPLYPLNNFPNQFVRKLAESICVHLATRGEADLEGKDWEKIFADCIGAKWSPSNIGLDDITHIQSSTAWGAKTVKGKIPTTSEANRKPQKVRLISGRNSPNYSYEEAIDPKKTNPNAVGEMVLEIWNTRVREVRARFENLRTVVLVKGDELGRVAVFELDTELYIVKDFTWKWNKNGNLEGFDRTLEHRFTWQPHGSQFTIIDSIPHNALRLSIRRPKDIPKTEVLKQIGFNDTFFSKI
jgi:hypothetical protein